MNENRFNAHCDGCYYGTDCYDYMDDKLTSEEKDALTQKRRGTGVRGPTQKSATPQRKKLEIVR